jgi:AcrR family transcriptional regulator
VRSTKERIVDAAVHLFNKEGVGPVTTNHIAAHLGMSPGNIYYHFKNKEEIVRHAFERMNDEADEVWEGGVFGPALLEKVLVSNIELSAKYTFFARELPALLRADPVLKRNYRRVQEERMAQLERALTPLLSNGVLKDPGGKEEVRMLVESAWILGLFGLHHGELVGKDASLTESARIVLHLFKPYIEPFAYKTLALLVESALEDAARELRTA